ncbi:MAG: RND family efflux transporter MFP subunit [Gammaproteobacteria bacterium]|jgi:RND family efflux transporter MFP subunit
MKARTSTDLVAVALFLAALVLPCGVWAQSATDTDRALNCTIEPRKTAKIGSSDDGIIESVLVDRGDIVNQGQVLATLESRTEKLAVDLARLQAKQDVEVRSRQARVEFQRSESARVEALFKKKMVSDKELDDARVQEELAKLDLESAVVRREAAAVELSLAEARLDRRIIRSPINAIVTEVSMAPGEYIHEQTPLLTLALIDDLKVEVFVPVSRYGQVALNQKATVEPVQPIGGQYEAVVSVVDRVFDAASGTFGVRLKLDNPNASLPAGIRCKVRFADAVRAAD